MINLRKINNRIWSRKLIWIDLIKYYKPLIQEIDKLINWIMGAHSLGDHFRVHTFAPLWLMCDRFGNTCSQRKKLKCEVNLGSQNNPDVWSIQEHIRTKNTNKFWLKKAEDKIDKTESRIEVGNYCPLRIKIEMR